MGRLACLITALASAAALAISPAAVAECIDADQLEASPIPGMAPIAGALFRDRQGRMVAPVTVNGEGPYRFIVDTGANRSVISRPVADALGLRPYDTDEVHSIHGVTEAPVVRLNSMRYGPLQLPSSAVPLLDGGMLAGEQGLLGVDSMQGRRLKIDFERRCIEIAPAESARRLWGWTTLQGELRFGHLIVVRGTIRDIPVNLLIDTGSDASLANRALRRQLGIGVRLDQRRTERVRAYTAGAPIYLDSAVLIPRIEVSDIRISNLLAYVGDFHIFRLWELEDEPTLLIGMDVLSQTRAMAVDYTRETVHFRLPRNQTGTRIQRR